MRIDKWLWATRFFKTRGQAKTAVLAGRIDINDGKVKPSRTVSPGDIVRVRKDRIEFEVEALELPRRRGPAAEAQSHYQETSASIDARALVNEQRKLAAAIDPGGRRPTKRQRRDLERFKRGSGPSDD